MRKLIVVAVILLVAVAAFAAGPKPGTKVTVVGTLNKGVENSCKIVKEDKSGDVYSFTNKLPKGVKYGNHVEVKGTVLENSICQQGTPINMTHIKRVK
jgi:hypothetical protein